MFKPFDRDIQRGNRVLSNERFPKVARRHLPATDEEVTFGPELSRDHEHHDEHRELSEKDDRVLRQGHEHRHEQIQRVENAAAEQAGDNAHRGHYDLVLLLQRHRLQVTHLRVVSSQCAFGYRWPCSRLRSFVDCLAACTPGDSSSGPSSCIDGRCGPSSSSSSSSTDSSENARSGSDSAKFTNRCVPYHACRNSRVSRSTGPKVPWNVSANPVPSF